MSASIDPTASFQPRKTAWPACRDERGAGRRGPAFADAFGVGYGVACPASSDDYAAARASPYPANLKHHVKMRYGRANRLGEPLRLLRGW